MPLVLLQMQTIMGNVNGGPIACVFSGHSQLIMVSACTDQQWMPTSRSELKLTPASTGKVRSTFPAAILSPFPLLSGHSHCRPVLIRSLLKRTVVRPAFR